MFKRLYYILAQRLYVWKNRRKKAQGRVLMFHRIDDSRDLYAISKDHFEKLIDELLKNHKIVDVKTLIEEKDERNVVLTFDDVYVSVYENAYPILKERGLPFYLFVCNEYLDQKDYLASSMVSEMLRDSKAILGSHNYVHELSRFAKEEEVKERMMRSKLELSDRFSCEIRDFAFPFGSFYACSDEDIEIAKGIFDHVFMTYPLAYHEEDGNVIARINMNDAVFERISE